MTSVHLGLSTCPNDTFAFHALMNGLVDLRGLRFDVELLDVQELNRRLLAGEFDVAKASFHAALHLADACVVLRCGSALGFGVGPVLLGVRAAARPADPIGEPPRPARVLCPGRDTTATLLYRLFHSGEGAMEQIVFSEIMPALVRGDADFGVCIHEGRFTYMDHGLHLIEDLGTTWEQAVDAPLPLGGILGRRALGRSVVDTVQEVLADSLRWAEDHREATLPTMRRHAQELGDEAIWAHVDLYVNAWTHDLGSEGARALEALAHRAAVVGLVRRGAKLEIG